MKKAVFVLALLLVCGVAVAETENTQRGTYVTPIPPITNWLNTNNAVYHSHAFDQFEYEMPLGLGVNANLFQVNEDIGLGVEYKYDFMNEKNSVFGVMNVDLYNIVKNLF